MSETNEFIHASLVDMQESIRAFDWKAEVLLLGMSIPLFNISGIAATLQQLLAKSSGAGHVAIAGGSCIIASAWTAGFALSLWVLAAVKNPAQVTAADDRPAHPTFFTASLFRLSIWRALSGRVVRASRTLSEHVSFLPADEINVTRELAFEQLKLGFILERKVRLFNAAVCCTLVGVVAGCALWLVHLFV